jgi:hypothetical protein
MTPGSRLPGRHLLLGLALLPALLAACGIAANGAAQPTVPPTPQVSLSATLQVCRADLATVLSAAGFNLVQPSSAVRPGESPILTRAPRTVGQVQLPGDPDHGFIVLYEFPDPASAYAAAQQQAAYIGTGEGRIQFVPDAKFTLRQDGSCVLFYNWSPSASSDPRSPAIDSALQSFGIAISIPR